MKKTFYSQITFHNTLNSYLGKFHFPFQFISTHYIIACKVGFWEIHRGVFSHPRVTKFRGWHPWKGDNSKFKISKIYRFWQTDSLHRGNWPCWVQIWHYFWARPTPSLSFWLFLSKTWKKSEKLVGQIVSQIRPCLHVHKSFPQKAAGLATYDSLSPKLRLFTNMYKEDVTTWCAIGYYGGDHFSF